MIEQGNGEIQKRINQGLCPKCLSQLVDKAHGHHCVICGLDIIDVNKSEKSVDNSPGLKIG